MNTQLARDVTRSPTDAEKALTAIWAEVLNIENVGLDDDFFELGGHSLLAVRVISRIREVFDVDLETPLLVFENPSVAALAEALVEARASSLNAQRIESHGQTEPAPLSFIQEQLWFFDQLAPGSPVYNIVDVITLKGVYDADAMKRAITELVRRHAVLRTAISADSGEPLQVVASTIDIDLKELDLTSSPASERDKAWARIAREEGRKAFDLTRAPLFRTTLVHFPDQESRLLLTIHHVIADEWSMELLRQEVTQLYDAFSRGAPSPLPELSIQYTDFARWQRRWLQGEVLEKQRSFWKHELTGAPSILELPTDKPRPAVQSFCGATHAFTLPKTLVEQLNAVARSEQSTLFMVLESAFATLLHRYTGQDDLLVGTPISGRAHAETQNLIGCFLNTVVLRSRFEDGMTFRSLLRQTRERALGAYAHADLPFEHLMALSPPARDSSRTPLFQVMFILHNPDALSQASKLSGSPELETGTSKFDLTLFAAETEDGLEGLVEYSTDLFEADTIRRLGGHYARLLEAIAANPDEGIWSLPLITDAERRQLVVEWNDTAIDFPARDIAVHQLIEAQAARTPDQVAVVFEHESLTYAELDQRASGLARQLRSLDVHPDEPVGVLVERSLDMVVAILGVLKAGATYVPLDPSFPSTRLTYMIEDSRMRVLITHRELDRVPGVRLPSVIDLDRHPTEPALASEVATGVVVAPSNLAYILYTSGSTGNPKGVAIPHSALTNFLLSMQREPGFTASDTILAVTTLSFDIAGLELYLPLVSGGRVVVASREDMIDPERLTGRIRESGCTVMQATPSTWRALVNSGWSGAPELRILCGGEALPSDLAEALLSRCGELWNMYGPTETTIWSTIQRVAPTNRQAPIGRPIANTQVFVLDAHRNAVPVGVPGELCIGGLGLARGYLYRDELTRDRFVANPFTSGARLYRTGDLARWLPDGRLEWIARLDHQVKVRGLRIELGEIEATLARNAEIRDVVVVAREDTPGDARLVAYFVAPDPPPDLLDQLRASIRAQLPEYMMPARFIALDALPRTANGKIDRKALPAPTDEGAPRATATPPRTSTEAMVATAFGTAVGRTDFGVFDSFFDLGGHSLMAARLISQLRVASGVDVPLRMLFERPTVAGLAEAIDAFTWSESMEPSEETGDREEIVL